ncbi:putative nucleotidyltransferase, Ribonuclease H [Helianthus annuus]|nr:putative nucleotidyltransferase, Ribonuclease H [Helianthus annuus]KAJ0928004.1 putative nucleotidyltransferase, Ribonuclease H [Helianthus annuus]
MREDIKNFIATCHTCQTTKASFLPPAGLLQPLPIPELVLESIAMDYITTLPSSHDKTVIMVVIDRLGISSVYLFTLIVLVLPIHLSTKLFGYMVYHPQPDGQTEVSRNVFKIS